MINQDSKTKLKTDIIETFGTPCAVVDLDILEKNIHRIQQICNSRKIRNRPHIKTHKSPKIAKMQINAGARGITCQKLGEAEVMVNAGIKDIIIATNILGAARSGRLAALQKKTNLKICADNVTILKAYSESARAAGRPINILIECDTGQKRAGVETPKDVHALANIIKKDPMLRFSGLLFYPPINNWENTQLFLNDASDKLKSIGMQEVSIIIFFLKI